MKKRKKKEEEKDHYSLDTLILRIITKPYWVTLHWTAFYLKTHH